MNKMLINTPQNICIEYALASVATRMVAVIIDYFIVFSYSLLMGYLINEYLYTITDTWLLRGLQMLIFLPVLFYPILMETLNGGQTIGKKIMKIKVVRMDGGRATIYEYFVRWLMSILDIWSNMGAVGIISIVSTKHNQRLGDLLAGTVVINLKENFSINNTVFEEVKEPEKYIITYPEVALLTDKDMNIIKNTYKTAYAAQNDTVMSQLANKIVAITKIQHIQEAHPAFFVNTIIQDYYEMYKNK